MRILRYEKDGAESGLMFGRVLLLGDLLFFVGTVYCWENCLVLKGDLNLISTKLPAKCALIGFALKFQNSQKWARERRGLKRGGVCSTLWERSAT